MHMANHLVSTPVALGGWTIALSWLGFAGAKCRKQIDLEKLKLVALVGAFVFAAQMVNFKLPTMEGTSGHIVGGVLSCFVLGPFAGSIAVAAVLLIQCLLFNDGGLFAYGCNVINMAIVPAVLVLMFEKYISNSSCSFRMAGAAVISFLSVVVASVLVAVEALVSNVVENMFGSFLSTMISVHIEIGMFEAGLTVLLILLLMSSWNAWRGGTVVLTRRFYLIIGLAIIITAGGFSLLACQHPDGLEWSYAQRPDEPGFVSIINNDSVVVEAVDVLQNKIALLPDYGIRGVESVFGTSVAGLFGSAVVAGLLILTGGVFRLKTSSIKN